MGFWLMYCRPSIEPGPKTSTDLICSEESLGKHLVGIVDAAVEVDGAHESLEAVGHGVTHLCDVAEVRPVGVQHVVLKTQRFGENSLREKFHI